MKKIFLAILHLVSFNNLFSSQDSKSNFAVTVKSNVHDEKSSVVSEFILIQDESTWEIVTIGTDLDSIPDLPIFNQSVIQKKSSDKEITEELTLSCCSNLMNYLTTLVTSLKDSFARDSHKKE